MKTFTNTWGAGYVYEGEAANVDTDVPIDFYREDIGYTPDDIAAISALKLGASYMPDAGHTVTRTT